MAKHKVAILGGGVGSLVTAYYLTEPGWRDRFDITIYQMGWRVGGKGASGRNQQYGMRIEEHGLHIWLGCYDNAFATIQKVYADLKGEPGVFQSWDQAFKPKPYTPVGLGTGHEFLQFFWPPNDNVPGSPGVLPSLAAVIEDVLGLLKELLDSLLGHVEQRIGADVVAKVRGWFERAHERAATVARSTDQEGALNDVADYLRNARDAYAPAHDSDASGSNPLWQLLNITHACIRGILNPKYGIMQDGDLNRIDDYEFCEWLADNGASKEVLDPTLGDEPFLRAFYDLGFFYEVTDQGLKPNIAAGTALRCLIRIAALYKGAGLYEMQAGMGETVVMPLYKVLLKRGVKFEFFRKLKQLEVNANAVDAIDLTIQATVTSEPYVPTFRVPPTPQSSVALDCWPDQPDWSQLQDGEKMKDAGINFESNWLDGDGVGTQRLERGRDFDSVVIGIALGALMKLNDQPSIVQGLIDASPVFRAATEQLKLIPTYAVQIWAKDTLAQLGWNPKLPAGYAMQPPAGVGLVEPLDVWADMSHLLPLERWPAPAPQSLHYFCGPLDTSLFAQPSRNRDVPLEADVLIKQITDNWFANCTTTIWPNAATPGGGLNNAVLYDITGHGQPTTLNAQYFRANVDPTECCVGSLAGTTQYRLHANGTGISNLYLAGAWTRTGYNTECVEGATMSGMAAARALSGEPIEIMGEYFLQSR